eukprot:TRINITY_DN8377_c0_g6_i1.p1 TRINITY_DN8377_c0_g6~~TRINITY_DN8377_c0_g6_i1.p1  ORF type:complete len:723 (-),score=121.59 TRINITY_DN8377_c0_g6_i1:170-2275(-)
MAIYQKGDAQKALEKYREALEIYNETATEESLDAAGLFLRMASALRLEGKLDEALEMLDSAWSILKKRGSDHGLNAANVLRHYGNIWMMKGKLSEARSNYQACWKIHEDTQTCTTLKAADCLRYMGELHLHLGDYEAAAQHFQQAFRVIETRGMIQTPDLAQVISRIAEVDFLQGHYHKAHYGLMHAIGILQVTGTINTSPMAATAYYYLGCCSKKMGHYTSAREALSRALEIFKSKNMGKSIYAAKVFCELGSLHLARDDHQEALESIQTAWGVYVDSDCTQSSDAADCLRQLGSAFLHATDVHKALEYLQKSREIHELNALSGKPNHLFAATLKDLASLRYALGHLKNGADDVSLALRILQDCHLSRSPDAADLLWRQGRFFLHMGRYREAQHSLLEAKELYTASGSTHCLNFVQVLRLQGQLHEEGSGDVQKAEGYWKEADAILDSLGMQNTKMGAVMLMHRACGSMRLGRFEDARAKLTVALEIVTRASKVSNSDSSSESFDPKSFHIAICHRLLGSAEFLSGNLERAYQLYQKALSMHDAMDTLSTYEAAHLYACFGDYHMEKDDQKLGDTFYAKSLATYEVSGSATCSRAIEISNRRAAPLVSDAFKRFEKGGNLLLDETNLPKVLSQILTGFPEDQITQLIAVASRENNGRLTTESFLRWVFDSDSKNSDRVFADKSQAGQNTIGLAGSVGIRP